MTKTVILGKTGMLGSEVEKCFIQNGQEILTTSRNILNAETSDIKDIVKILDGFDYAINCIGIIKPYIHDDNSSEVQRAIYVNALFPHKLAEACEITGTKLIQIATDCVYDGVSGNYTENSAHNPLDVYGKTKSLGEIHCDNTLNLRCSIIGREKKNYLSLLEWFLNQNKSAKVNGYKNHFWNGVTTRAFAKICLGIINNNVWFSGFQHIAPKDTVTKAQMLHIFKKVFNRSDIEIEDINAPVAINRTLSTVHKDKNEMLWKNAGYTVIPTIEEMIQEIGEN